MGLGNQSDDQSQVFVMCADLPRSPGHVFYDRLQSVLIKGGFDRFVEKLCEPYYASGPGRKSIPPGRYFRMHLVGYFEEIESERGLEWRCSDSLSLRKFLRLSLTQRVPDHSSLSRIRQRLPLEVHQEVFGWVLQALTKSGLVVGERLGIDASTMEANAAMRSIVRRDTGETYQQMLERIAKDSGIKTPTREELARMDRKRKGKKLSNKDWKSESDEDARITKMKDSRTHLAYKPEHAVDLDTGAIVSADIHKADQGDTTTIGKTLESARKNLSDIGCTPITTAPTEVIADKGYHSREVVKELDGGVWRTRIAEPKANGLLNWKGDHEARRAVYNNRARLKSAKGRELATRRTELVERSFQHVLDRGGMRRTHLRGQENVHKRYLLCVAGFNLGLLMRQLIGFGTPKGCFYLNSAQIFIIVWGRMVVSIILVEMKSETGQEFVGTQITVERC